VREKGGPIVTVEHSVVHSLFLPQRHEDKTAATADVPGNNGNISTAKLELAFRRTVIYPSWLVIT
jgi:hypothetical protein